MNNIVKEKEQSMNNSIHNNYLVTEKADGIRKLLFIAKQKSVFNRYEYECSIYWWCMYKSKIIWNYT